ncbi:MAG: P-loop NTPase [Actinomycetota bacterium]|nr:sodium:proton antiporter [Acidimicrobiaceae bacterium]MEC7174788.1 P-loop NTPase [Actinomycetota bacterium]MEC7434434.1 P-loop NTPase [Actinomycetota bacterium]MEC7579419.1 P-loop NTPase [Actinomycetota bacterium]MEC8464524.1 P-loop NTPase [Actinomycetota bacterium]
MSAERTAPPTVEEVTDVLSTVIDPELGSDVVSLGMIPRTEISPDGAVVVEVRLTISGCPMRAEIKKMVEQRLLVHPGVTKVRLEWSEMDSDERSAAMSTARAAARDRAPETAIGQRCQVLAISSGKGGVGKSSVTVNLAAGLAEKGFTVGVLDADIWGFSVPRLLGMSDRLDAHEVDGRPHIIPNRKRIGEGVLEVVSTGFLVEESTALMWRGLMLTKAVEQFLRDVAWGDLDYLLIDMPPGTGDVQMGLARLLPRTSLLVVTTPATAAQRVAQRAADMAQRSFLPVLGVIENMSGFICEHGDFHPVFGQGGGQALAEAVDAPLLGSIPIETSVSAGGDCGEPVILSGTGAAAASMRSIVDRIVTDVAPPVDVADELDGCATKILAAFDDAFAAEDQRNLANTNSGGGTEA